MNKQINEKFKNYDTIKILCDEESVLKSTIEEFDLEDYCVKTKQGWKISFVGFIIRRNSIIISFPKKYIDEKDSISINDINLLLKLISRITTTSPTNWDNGDIANSFPLKSYLGICNYYVRNGFHFSQIDSYTYGYSGKINWNRTIKYSPNYVNRNQVHYMPYVISKNNHLETIITSAMKFVLEDGYKKVGEYFELGIPYFNQDYTRIASYESILIELRYLKSKSFNDNELGLINYLIKYFEWITGSQDEVIIVTMNFESVWQKICNNYLLNNLNKVINLSTHTNNINIDYQNIKYLEKNQIIKQKARENRKVIYDHLLTDGNNVILLDSKYYTNVDKDLDYKQLSYHYLVSLHESVTENQVIINGLIAPTEMESHSGVHIDLTDNNNALFDGVKILIYNLNLKEIMTNYVS